jgi:hypothetical protein
MVPESSLPHSQEPATSAYPEPDEKETRFLKWKIHFKN